MDSQQFERYLNDRYLDQFNYTDRKAVALKRKYSRMQGTVVVLAAMTTVTAAIGSVDGIVGTVGQWAAVVVSALVTIISGLLATFKYKEEWLNYRAAAEALKREQYYFQARVGGYKTADDPEALFVRRVEATLASENVEWLGIQRLQDAEGKQQSGQS